MSTFETICASLNLGLLVQDLSNYISLILLAVQVGIILLRIVKKIINVAKKKDTVSKADTDNLFDEDISDLKTLLSTLKIKGE